jgi:hypothetical protein
MVIKDQKLDMGHGLSISPEQDYFSYVSGNELLGSLLIKKEKKDTSKLIFYAYPTACFTKEDTSYMFKEKTKFKNFAWDIEQFGFNGSNDKNYYAFTIPLFSIDHKKALITVDDLCPGLCGSTVTLLYTYKRNKWTSESFAQGVF